MNESNFRNFLEKTIEICGADRLKNERLVEKYTDNPWQHNQDESRMVSDMSEGKVFDLFLDEPEDAYEKSIQILKDHGHEETEIRVYLDVLKDVLEHRNPEMETEDEKMLEKAQDYAFGLGECQDYEKAAKLIEETTIWEYPRGNFIGLMSATKNQENDISQILNGEPVKNRISPNRYAQYKKYMWQTEGEEDAIDLLIECAEDGIPEAQYLLGRCYGLKDSDSFVTRYIQPDEEKAKEWIEKAKQNGFTEEADPLEEEFAVIDAEHPDLNALKELAEDGYAEAQIRYGETFPYESKERRTWMKKAVRQGNVTAMRKLAVLYRDVEHDQDCYVIWLRQAADEDDPEAMYLLGCEYLKPENEDGTDNPDFDESEGRNLIELAADDGVPEAVNRLQEMRKGDDQ